MLGIIGAMDDEVAMIKAQLTDVQVETRAAMDFYKGKLEGKEVVVVRSGIGKVNAAMCTQILADIYGVTGVVNMGIAAVALCFKLMPAAVYPVPDGTPSLLYSFIGTGGSLRALAVSLLCFAVDVLLYLPFVLLKFFHLFQILLPLHHNFSF